MQTSPIDDTFKPTNLQNFIPTFILKTPSFKLKPSNQPTYTKPNGKDISAMDLNKDKVENESKKKRWRTNLVGGYGEVKMQGGRRA